MTPADRGLVSPALMQGLPDTSPTLTLLPGMVQSGGQVCVWVCARVLGCCMLALAGRLLVDETQLSPRRIHDLPCACTQSHASQSGGGDGSTPSLLDARAASPSAVYAQPLYAATPFRGALAALPIDAAVHAPLVDNSPFNLTVRLGCVGVPGDAHRPPGQWWCGRGQQSTLTTTTCNTTPHLQTHRMTAWTLWPWLTRRTRWRLTWQQQQRAAATA
jgi:hypothetical protein